MSTTLPVLLLFLGLAIGAMLGWLGHAYLRPTTHPESGGQPAVEGPGRDQERLLELLEESQARSQQAALAAAGQRQEEMERSLAPLEKALYRLGIQLKELEADRATAFASLTSQVQSMARTSTRLNDKTDQLVTALRSPNVRGRWGEMQLERVVELGGMLKHVDFDSQVTATVDGKTYRPDLVIHLAGGRNVVVDAKVPFSSYLDALESQDPEEHAAYLRRHAHLLRNHVNALGSKDYVGAFFPTPEFVILFVPADPFLDAALSVDNELLEHAFERGVVIATPSTLFALLRTVALGWQQEDMSDKAREVQRLGRDLYSRINTMGEHYNKVGKGLERAVEAYNQTIASLDSRVMVTARRLAEMDIPGRADRHPTVLKPVEDWPRRMGGGQ
ncbi:DNA recombination protein RmuC [Corynebacterium endometrii]|uniref:DNA recombination protein RmuC n=1 Tax=Corynebacterium endometrii TaxID=2488819 RepID=A0A4P7QGP2_9CORY|nr:DNA recombination protein RmuC [Corynebacterium endometrii]QCB28136.1 DNA recombination protein RmuC [Corynebacterium endometrii]